MTYQFYNIQYFPYQFYMNHVTLFLNIHTFHWLYSWTFTLSTDFIHEHSHFPLTLFMNIHTFHWRSLDESL